MRISSNQHFNVCNNYNSEISEIAFKPTASSKRFKRNNSNDEYQRRTDESISDPSPKLSSSKMKILKSDDVVFRLFIQCFLCVFKIKNCKEGYRKSCKANIVELIQPLFIRALCAKCAYRPVPKCHLHKQDIFIEDIPHHVRISSVCLSSVDEQQCSQKLKLSYCVIRCSRCLLSLKPANSDSYVGRCYHIDVICSVAYCKSNFFWESLLDHHDKFCFLFWGYSASKNHIHVFSKFHELFFYFLSLWNFE